MQGHVYPDSKVPGANMGPICGRQDPAGPHVGPMNFAIWDSHILNQQKVTVNWTIRNTYLWHCKVYMCLDNDIVNRVCI